MSIEVKICGVRTPDAIAAAVTGGARYIGFVFYPPSPRSLSLPLAGQLARGVPTGVRTVGLLVDPDDALIEQVVGQVPLDLLQLHGSETPERVAQIRADFQVPVMKALRIAGPEDLMQVAAFEDVADRLLFDAKPPANVASLPGGNGIPFDWTLLAGRAWRKPWMLSGGLTLDNLAEAVATAGATAVDVSSGVEDRPGVKSVEKIKAFLDLAKRLG